MNAQHVTIQVFSQMAKPLRARPLPASFVSNRMLKNYFGRHSRESGNPENPTKSWIPAFAGMTNPSNFGLFQHPANGFAPNSLAFNIRE
ncbi:MAG: hypothetical protein ACREOO_29445 [bacterium]